jgi:hypothetical protein
LRRRQAERIGCAGAVLPAVVGRAGIVGITVRIVVDKIDAAQRLEPIVDVERGEQRVDAFGCPRLGLERGAVPILRNRIGAKVVIERDVFLEDHDHVLGMGVAVCKLR